MKNNNNIIEMIRAVKDAGVLHIDTAHKYGNEKALGDALKSLGMKNIFITTKVNPVNMLKYVRESVMQSKEYLGVQKIDQVLLHGPVNRAINAHAFRELVKLRDKGIISYIGVSNFSIEELKNLKKDVGEYPSTNQIFISPSHINLKLVEFCMMNDIIPSAYSSLRCLFWEDDDFFIKDKSIIEKYAKRYNKNNGQIVLRWLLDREINVVFQSRNPKRIIENVKINDFKLSDKEILEINSLDQNKVFDDGMKIKDELLKVGEIY